MEKVSILCEELGIHVPKPNTAGEYEIQCDGLSVAISTSLPDKRYIVLVGNLGSVTQLTEDVDGTPFVPLITQMMTLHVARVKKLGIKQVLTLNSDKIVLWEKLDIEGGIPEFMSACEAMFNELEFWQQKYSSTVI